MLYYIVSGVYLLGRSFTGGSQLGEEIREAEFIRLKSMDENLSQKRNVPLVFQILPPLVDRSRSSEQPSVQHIGTSEDDRHEGTSSGSTMGSVVSVVKESVVR